MPTKHKLKLFANISDGWLQNDQLQSSSQAVTYIDNSYHK